MSARTPFFPGGASNRPSAHATSSESTANGHGGTPAGSKFLPDLSNPLHAFSGSGHKATASGKANGAVNNMMGMGDASASVPDIGNVNGNPPPVPQLNTSGFKKKKGSLATPSNNKNSGLGAGAAGSGAFSNTAVTGIDGFGISRPATADPHRTANVAGHGSTGIRPRASLGSNLDPSSGAPGANGRQGGAGGGGGARNPFGSKPTSHPPKLLAPAPITAASPSLFNTNGVNHVGGTFNANLDSSGSAPSFSGLTTPGVALTGQNGADMRQDRDWAGLAPERPHTSMRNDQGRNVSNAVQQSNQQQAFRGPVFNLGVARTPDTSTETLVDQDDDSFDHSRGSKPGLDGFGQFLPTSGSGIVGDAAGGGGGGGPRRVILDKGYHQNHGNQYDDRGQHDLLSGHAINDQGRVFQQMPGPGMSAPGGRKRHREQADLDQDGMRYDMPGSNRMKMARVVDENQGMDDHMQEDYDVSQQPRPMQKIMKMDMDDFFENHLDHYDQAVARWTDCSFKEWFDGAEELTNKFTECLNSAKEYMLKELKVHTDLHTVLDAHKAKLNENERALKAAMGMAREDGLHLLR